MMNAGYELVDHTADIGVHAWGHTREEVFELAAEGMFSLICDPMTIETTETVDVAVDAPQTDHLLAAWLNELQFRYEATRVVFEAFEVTELTDTTLKARVSGEPMDSSRHAICGGVKAATLHQLSLTPTPAGGWEGFVLLDV
jgi:SHS2 domain-containing protein